jgi:acetyl esterase/lipase
MTSTPRTAAVQLRGSTGPTWSQVYWPPPDETSPPPLLVLFSDDPEPEKLAQLCLRSRLVVLACPTPSFPETAAYDVAVAEAKAVVGWAADHAGELDADPYRLLLAGTGTGAALATEVARLAADEGWPDLTLLDLLEGTSR